MRKKRATLWLLLCGVCVIGGAAYLNKAEPLKAADKSETAQTKQTAPTAKTKAVAKTPAVTQTGEEMVPIGPPDENYSTLPNFNFQQLSGDVHPSKTNRASMPEGYGFVGSLKRSSSGATNYELYAPILPTSSGDIGYGNFKKFETGQPLTEQYFATYYYLYAGSGTAGRTQFMWQRLPSPSNLEIADGLAFAYYADEGNGNQGGLATTEPVVKYNSDEAFGYAYGEYELGSPNFFGLTWAAGNKASVPTDSSMEIMLRDHVDSGKIDGNISIGYIKNLAENPVDSFFLGFNKSAFEKKDEKYFTIYLEKVNQTPVFFRNLMVLMTSVHAENPTAIKIPLGKDVVPYLTADALKQTMGDVYYYPDAANHNYDVNDPQGGEWVNPATISNLKILSENVPTSDLISKKKLMIQFNYQIPDEAQETKVGIVPIDFEITAGNSIFLGGDEKAGIIYKNNPNLSSLAFTLNNVGDEATPKYQIAATKGNNPNGDAAFNTNANATQPYYQVDYFAPPADGETLNLNQDLTTKGAENGSSLVAVNDSTPNALISSWGTDGKLDVELGGVLRVYMSDPTKEWLYQNDELNTQFKPNNLPQKNYVFYQVTETGLEPIYSNQVAGLRPLESDKMKIAKNTPAPVVSNIFTNDPNANQLYLKPFKKEVTDYTFVWDFKEGTGNSAGGYLYAADVIGQEKNSPIAIKFPFQALVSGAYQNVAVQVTNDVYVPWLPNLNDDGSNTWQDSATATIPGGNAFVLRYSDNETLGKTKVVAQSAGLKDNGSALSFTADKDSQWMIMNNLGYYNGNKIAVKMTVTPVTGKSSNVRISMNHTKDYMLSVVVQDQNKTQSPSVDVKYEFLKQTDADYGDWEPIELSGYWTFSPLSTGANLTLPLSLFEGANAGKIYSYSRNFELNGVLTPILLKYQKVDDNLIISSDASPSQGVNAEQQKTATITYNKKTSLEYKLSVNSTSNYAQGSVNYSSKAFPTIGIPAPEGLTQTVANVTADQYPDSANGDKIKTPINNAFVQMLPYENEANDYKPVLEWTLTSDGDNADTLASAGSWTVVNEAGESMTDKFDFADVEGGVKITVKGGVDPKDLFNHNYIFQRNLKIDDTNTVDPTKLTEREDGMYLANKGTVALKIDDDDVETSNEENKTYQTDVNFAANLPFTYSFFGEDGNVLATQPTAPENGWTPASATALITQNYKSNGFNDVKSVLDVDEKKYGLMGYGISGQDYPVSGDTIDNVKIKYSENPVTLKYQQDYGAGAMPELTVDNSVEFGENTIAKVNDLPQINDWNLKVENAPGMFITAIRDDFTADGGKILGATLTLYADGTPMVIPTDGAAPVTKEIPSDGAWTITSGETTANAKTAGFKLNVPAGNITAGKQYKSTITFTLTDAPGN